MIYLKYYTSSRALAYEELRSFTRLADSDYLVLKQLCDGYPHPINKSVLIENAWSERVVTESSIKVTIHKLRKVLKEELDMDLEIKSIRHQGYVLDRPATLNEVSDKIFHERLISFEESSPICEDFLEVSHPCNHERKPIVSRFRFIPEVIIFFAIILVIYAYYKIGLL
ncbi:transcriptional regulator [Vibrio coralliilyticus]|uniref:winged helix-turn-helix domain-containing protein n=1 Tax=Vibrio coralliilyticus TaxID=190893 RepID=UPI003916EC95